MKMEETECSETLAIKLHTLENNPKENIRHSKHGDSLKSRRDYICSVIVQTSSGTLPSLRLVGNEGLFLRGNVHGHEANHTPPSYVQGAIPPVCYMLS
jgi:hypothetical protein